MSKFECIVVTPDELEAMCSMGVGCCDMCCFISNHYSAEPLTHFRSCNCLSRTGYSCFALEKRQHYFREIPDEEV